MNNEAAIKLEDVCYAHKSDWTFQKVKTLKNLSLEVKAGETFGFLGPNGAGKTTTIKCILNLIRMESGQIKIFGKDSHNSESRQSVGYLPEQPYFYDHLSVQEIMEMYASLAGVKKSEVKSHVKSALEKVNMSERKNMRMRSLSKGLMQRVAMAQAIVANPRLLILDEPFSGLDPLGRKEFRDLIFSLKKDGVTIFMASHILSDVEFLCDRASITVKGELRGVYNLTALSESSKPSYEIVVSDYQQIVDLIKPFSVKTEDEGKTCRIVCDSRKNANMVVEKILQSSANMESFQLLHSNLEDIFIKAVKIGGEPK